MKAFVWAVMLGVLLVGPGVCLAEACSGGGGSEMAEPKRKIPPWRGYVSLLRLETIGKKLGDGALSEEQLTRIRVLREDTIAKVKEWLYRPETMDARDEVARAKAAGDKEALAEAMAKLKEVGDGEEFVQAYREGLAGILSEEQLTKLYPPKKSAEEDGGGGDTQ